MEDAKNKRKERTEGKLNLKKDSDFKSR